MIPHIIIDARLYGPKHTGLGRYTKNLLVALKNLPDFKNYRFTLLVYPELFEEIKTDMGSSYRYVITPLRHYSLAEQFFLPLLLHRLRPDLVHFSHLDKPILYFGKSLVTVHDLIRHFSKGRETTTHAPYFYWLKYFGYILMTRIIFHTSHIIVPTEYWRNYIVANFHLSPAKIITTYEAVDPDFPSSLPEQQRTRRPENYIVYTGNLYPHKNIYIIIRALKHLPNLRLKVICARLLFRDRLEKIIRQYHVASQVDFLGYLSDTDAARVYSRALALVHPALIEGFGLTGLEAMTVGCPVISSNSSCLPEVYHDAVLYFNPHQPRQLVAALNRLRKQPRLRQQLIARGYQLAKSYSWSNTARLTLDFYDQILSTA